jgi:hypothetical protein
MSSIASIGIGVPSDTRSTQGPSDGQRVDRIGPQRVTPTMRADRACAHVLDAGCKALGSNEDAAEYLDLDSSLLTKMRQGSKPTAFRVIWQLLGHPDEAVRLAVINAQARYARVSESTPLRKVTREECDRELAAQVRTTYELFRLYRPKLAAALGTTEDDVEAAYGVGR